MESIITLPEEYRPAVEIQPGWEIRTEDHRWLRVTAWFEWTSTDPAKPVVIVLHLADESECRSLASDLIMTRKLS